MGFDEKDFVAGAACLDFVNTVGGRRDGAAEDKLARFGDLVDWARTGGLLSAYDAKKLMRHASRQPGKAAKVRARAIALREAFYRIVAARIDGAAAKPADIALLNREYSAAEGRRRLCIDGDVWRRGWSPVGDNLAAPLWPVAASAGEFLLSPDLDRLAECASETCGWLFLDLSKNGSRRWCDMRVCGNRAKMRRYRA